MKADYFLNKTADSSYGEESLIRLVHGCRDSKFYYIKERRPISWVGGKSNLDKGHEKFQEVSVFVLQDDLRYPGEMDYLWNIIYCPYCGYKFGEADK